jgi:hypothetical protein
MAKRSTWFEEMEAEDTAALKRECAGGVIWCLHCETAWEVDRIGDRCSCGASWAMDGWEWEKVLEQSPALPERPPHGFRCSLYGEVYPPLPEG